MKLYHTTNFSKEILDQGFKDYTRGFLTNRLWTGVWFSNMPLDESDTIEGDTVLMIEIPEKKIKRYEWIEEDRRNREFLIPAKIANKYGPPKIVPEDELLTTDYDSIVNEG